MTYAHHTFSEDSYEECGEEKRRVSYTRGRSYLAERRRGRKRSANSPTLTVNGRRRRRWSW